jgi:hypothetical protein
MRAWQQTPQQEQRQVLQSPPLQSHLPIQAQLAPPPAVSRNITRCWARCVRVPSDPLQCSHASASLHFFASSFDSFACQRPSSASAQSAQSHVEWSSSSRASSELDHHAVYLLLELERAAAALPRQMQVRVERWAVRLSGLSAATLSLQRDRDDYLRLLLDQTQRRQLSVPFDRSPPDGPLPRLPAYLVRQTAQRTCA